MDRPMPILVAMIASAALVVAGCGDDDGGGSDSGSSASGDAGSVTVTTSSLGKPQFVKQANGACRRERLKLPSRIVAFENRSGSGDVTEKYTGMVKAALLPTIEGEVAKVSELGAPAGDEESVEAMLSAQVEAVEEAKQLSEIEFPDGLQKYFAEPRRLMEDYGLSECSINFTLSPANAAAAEG